MCKKLFLLLFFALVPVLLSPVLEGATRWTGNGADQLWGTSANWNNGVPDGGTTVVIDPIASAKYPLIDANTTAISDHTGIGWGQAGQASLTIEAGGTLTTQQSLWIGRDAITNGVLYMNGGSINCGNLVMVGQFGHGTLHMTGGQIDIAPTGGMHVPHSTGTGHVDLHGGTITCTTFTMRRQGTVGTMDITEGHLIINGNHEERIQGYIDEPNGWITAYNGDPNFAVVAEYNSVDDQTILKVVNAAIAETPNPGNGTTAVNPAPILTWSPGDYAASHDIYLGTDYNDVNDANRPVSDMDCDGQVGLADLSILTQQWLLEPPLLGPSADLNDDNDVDLVDFAIIANSWFKPMLYKGRKSCDANSFFPGMLKYNSTYFWRVDEVNSPNIWKGPVWSFTTEAGPFACAAAYYMFDGDANDSSGNGNHGTENGSPAYVAGKFDQAISLDGGGEYVNCGNGSSLNPADAVTVAAWIYPTSYGSSSAEIVTKLDTQSNQRAYALRLDSSSNKLLFFVSPDGTNEAGNAVSVASDSSIPLDQWTHVAGTYDGSSIKVYVNGVADGSEHYSSDIYSSSADLCIGALFISGSPARYFSGRIDEVRIYDSALSQSGIEYLMSLAEPVGVDIYPQQTDDVVTNPGKGWVHYGWPGGKPQDYLALGSTAYNPWEWAELEPNDGEYYWAGLDSTINQWQECIDEPKPYAFRVMCLSSHSENEFVTPEWVFDAGAASERVYVGSDQTPNPGWKRVPYFDDATFLYYLYRFLDVLAERYDGDPNIAYIDIGSYGNWGEGHMSHIFNHVVPDISAQSFKNNHVIPHLNRFTETQLIINCPGFVGHESVYDWSVEPAQGCGARRDGIVSPYSNGSSVLRAYPNAPGIFEFYNTYQYMKDQGWWYGLNGGTSLEDCVENGKATYVGLEYGNPNSPMLTEEAELVDYLANRMGYHFVLQEVEYPEDVDRQSSTATIQLTLQNKGVAPIYVPCVVAIGLFTPSGELADVYWASECDPASWMPDEVVTEQADLYFTQAPAGDYILAVGLFHQTSDPDPAIRLAIDGQTIGRWHILGGVRLVE